MIASIFLQGYNESIRLIRQSQATAVAGLVSVVDVAAKEKLGSLVEDSPVDTHAMQGGWRRRKLGPMTWEISNEVNRKGFSYPSAQATGTGERGIATIGFTGTFSTGWKGMVPNPIFRSSWEHAAGDPMAVSASLF